MKLESGTSSTVGHVTLGAARRAAKAAKSSRSASKVFTASASNLERYLGHFGPPAEKGDGKRRAGAKKTAVKKIALGKVKAKKTGGAGKLR